jgi:hypothetical protein
MEIFVDIVKMPVLVGSIFNGNIVDPKEFKKKLFPC